MRLPIISNVQKSKKDTGAFAGINQSEVINENEFANMWNLSSDLYPAIGPRKPRGDVISTLAKANGIHYNDGLAWVDGTKFFYRGNEAGTVSDSRKQMVSMGAYIVIMPDKKVYNTSPGEWRSMETSWTQAAEAKFEPTTEASTFIRITCTGIGKAFDQWDGVTISGCTNENFNKSVVIQSKADDSIVVIGDLAEAFTQASGLKINRSAPDMDFITENGNRIWGCSSKNHEIYASKLGDPCNWNSFEGISTDSYAATIGSDGDFTGAATHLGYVLFFKEDRIHKVYGSKPSNIQINSYEGRGVKSGCAGSIQNIDGTLYFASCDGVCAYDGSLPYLISKNIKRSYSEARGGAQGGKYYLSMRTEQGTEMYVYDTQYRLWHLEDSCWMIASCIGSGELYYIDADQAVRKITGGTERIKWRMESGDQEEGSLDKKKLHKLKLLLELDRGAIAELWIRYENDPMWQRLQTITADKKQMFFIPLKPRRCEHYRWKLEGAGNFKLLGAAIEYGQGSGR